MDCVLLGVRYFSQTTENLPKNQTTVSTSEEIKGAEEANELPIMTYEPEESTDETEQLETPIEPKHGGDQGNPEDEAEPVEMPLVPVG